jgi:hypothetical protein
MTQLIKHPKRRGEWAELQFAARAASFGLIVCKPWGDTARFDFIVAHGSSHCRVQVKSTATSKTGYYKCWLTSRNHYKAADFDFLAVYIIPEEIWYVIPWSQVCRRSRALILHPHGPRSRYQKYLEAWHLLSKTAAKARAR